MRTFLAVLAVLAGALGLTATSAAAQPSGRVSSQYTRLSVDRCTEVPVPTEHPGQLVGWRCPGLGPHRLWLLYGEDRYLRVGVGRVGNISGLFDAERAADWPVEWRGRIGPGGGFQPFAMILRLRPIHRPRGAGDLVVWRLTGDGMACIVATVAPAPNQNQRARDAADRILSGGMACRQAPDPMP